MKIALIIENSQAAKSEVVHAALTAVAEPLGHQVFHYGMYTPEDKASLTYVMNGLLAGILLNSGAADFVVTGCGTAAELNLQDVYRKLFEGERGLGYPKERAVFMAKNRSILKDLKAVACNDMLTVLKTMDQDLLKAAVAGEKFQEYFFANATDEGIRDYLKSVVSA